MITTYDFCGRSGIITGAASGFGKALSLLLTESNASLALVDCDNTGLEATVRACRESRPGELLAVDADLSSEPDVGRMVHETLARFGSINFLVTGAGILYMIRDNLSAKEIGELNEPDCIGAVSRSRKAGPNHCFHAERCLIRPQRRLHRQQRRIGSVVSIGDYPTRQ